MPFMHIEGTAWRGWILILFALLVLALLAGTLWQGAADLVGGAAKVPAPSPAEDTPAPGAADEVATPGGGDAISPPGVTGGMTVPGRSSESTTPGATKELPAGSIGAAPEGSAGSRGAAPELPALYEALAGSDWAMLREVLASESYEVAVGSGLQATGGLYTDFDEPILTLAGEWATAHPAVGYEAVQLSEADPAVPGTVSVYEWPVEGGYAYFGFDAAGSLIKLYLSEERLSWQ